MAYKHVDADSSGGGDGSTWALSGGSAAYTLAEFDTWADANIAAGDTTFFKKATAAYSISNDMDYQAKDGNILAPIAVIGVKEATTNTGANIVYSDWAVLSSDRPSIDVNAFSFKVGQYWKGWNIDFTGSDSYSTVWIVDQRSQFGNCSSENTGNGRAWAGSTNSVFVNCYGKAPNNDAFLFGSNDCVAYFCHADGSTTGFESAVAILSLHHCIVSDCTIGINVVNDDGFNIVGCTIDDCTTGIEGVDAEIGVFINNIISNCTDGWKFNNSGSVITSNHLDYNNWYNNTRDMSWDNGSSEDNSAKGNNDTAVNPNYTAAGSDDYSLASGDCIDGGQSMVLGVG